jgi:hypothetical protein
LYYHPDQPTTAIPSNQPGVYPGAGYQGQGSGLPENGTAVPPAYQPSYNNATPTTPTTSSYAVPNPQATNYVPFGASENTAATPTYGAQPTTIPAYSAQPVPSPNNYGVPTATPAGFTANPSNYPPTTPPIY